MITSSQIGARPKIVLHRVRYQDDTHEYDGIGNIMLEETYRGAIVAKDLIQWSHVHSLPSILKFSEKTQNKIYQSGVTRQILLFVEHKDPNRDSIFSQASRFAERHRGEYLVVEVPTSEIRITNFFNLETFPAVGLFLVFRNPFLSFVHRNKPNAGTSCGLVHVGRRVKKICI